MLERDGIAFGDRVRIRSTPETIALGVQDHVGQVYGLTTPSISAIDVIGASAQDRAINVAFDGCSAAFWFAPELVEFVDHGAGTTVEIDRSKAVRNADGSWTSNAPASAFLARMLKIFR